MHMNYAKNKPRRIPLYTFKLFVYTQQNKTFPNNKMAPHQQLLICRALAAEFFSQPNSATSRVYIFHSLLAWL